jgi:hypothetical protein
MIEQRLLARLRERVNTRGVVPVRGDTLIQEVGASQEEVGAALDKLERAGLLRILAPFPFLVLKLHSWSGMGPKPGTSRSAAYSYSKLSSNRLNESYRPTTDDALLREILETLGETDPTSFEGAIKNFSPDVIRKALDRVRRTRSLRKNRTALFRYLLTKLS